MCDKLRRDCDTIRIPDFGWYHAGIGDKMPGQFSLLSPDEFGTKTGQNVRQAVDICREVVTLKNGLRHELSVSYVLFVRK